MQGRCCSAMTKLERWGSIAEGVDNYCNGGGFAKGGASRKAAIAVVLMYLHCMRHLETAAVPPPVLM